MRGMGEIGEWKYWRRQKIALNWIFYLQHKNNPPSAIGEGGDSQSAMR